MSGGLGSVARIGLTAAGYYFGGPIGGFAASLAGSLLFPEELPDVQGPRLGPDQPATLASIGAAIPIVYGTIDVNGTVIQDLGRVEIANTEEVGGKGGPTQDVTNYTYTRTYAVLLCEGEIDGVLRIWRAAKLVYDIRPQQAGESDADYQVRIAASEGFLEKCAIYLGTADQMPDPVLEAATGMGLQPAYRHRAYIVLYDEDVTDNGGRTSQWKFEVVANGVFSTSTETQYAVGVLYDWMDESRDPRNIRNRHVWSYDPPGAATRGYYETLEDALAVANAEIASSGREMEADQIPGWNIFNAPATVAPHDVITGHTVVTSLSVRFNADLPERFEGNYGVEGSPNVFDLLFSDGVVAENEFWWSGYSAGTSYNSGSSAGGRFVVDGAGGTSFATPPWTINNSCLEAFGCPYSQSAGDNYALLQYADLLMEVTRFPGAPRSPCDGFPSLPENPDFCVLNDGSLERNIGWALVTGPNGFKCLQVYVLENDPDSPGVTTSIGENDLPVGPIRPVGHADDTQAFWEAAEAASVIAGTSPPGRIYAPSGAAYNNRLTHYPVLTSEAYIRTLNSSEGTPVPVTLASIVSDLCLRTKRLTLDRIDVTDLSETVQGYRVDRAGTKARTAIDILRAYGYFDCVDGEKLKFPTRGKAIVAALDEDTLGAHEAGSQAPPLVEINGVEDVELPWYIGVRYPMPHKDYNIGLQGEPYNVKTHADLQYVDMPIAMSDAKAAQISEVLLAERYTGRETYKLAASPQLLALEAADAISFPLSGETQRACITSITGGFPGVLQIEARRDDPFDYVSTAAGVASGIRPQELGIQGLTVYALIDGPAFDERQDEPGFYVGAYGTGTRWRGASLYESLDGGENYTRILSVSSASTMGVIQSALPAGPWHVWDEANTLTVTLAAGTLESRTAAAVLNGANAAFVGADGRWELIQFRTATLLSPGVYELSGLLRGRRGTEWAIGQSVAGDTFVLCQTLLRVPKGSSAIGLSRLYKMVTARTLLESSEAETFSTDGVALECYAPAHVTADRDGSGNITFSIVRRSRIGPEWIDYADVPLNEDSERYQIDILDGSTVVRTLDSASASIAYSAALQTTDFGAPVGYGLLSVVAYQLSATVGRGYPTEATV